MDDPFDKRNPGIGADEREYDAASWHLIPKHRCGVFRTAHRAQKRKHPPPLRAQLSLSRIFAGTDFGSSETPA